MKYIYMVNQFQLKNKCDNLIKRLEYASNLLGRDYEIRFNQSPDEEKQFIHQNRDREYVITALGGDGSINLLVNELVGTNCIFSFVPVGTGNDFFRTCCETLSDGLHELDLIRINDRFFMNTACFGIDADIANDDHFIHNSFIPRPLRYHAGVLYHFLSYKGGRHMRVQCGGETIEKDFMTIVVAGGRYYGGGYKVSPDSLLHDGLMEIYLVDKVPKIKMAAMILSMKEAGHLKSPALRLLRTNKLQVSSNRPVRANIDGEPILAKQFDLELIPKGIRLDFNQKFLQLL